MNENITVLKDESLGGIEREYREVKRKAGVGERIKIVAKGFSYFDLGEVVHADAPGLASNSVRAVGDGLSQYVEDSEYVVLEPTDIIRIDNERLRMAERKATAGERIIIVKATCVDAHEYTNGDIGIVSVAGWPRVGAVDAKINGTEYHVWREEYRVLEPVESAKPLSAQPPIDQAAANISALQSQVLALMVRVKALESKVGRMDADIELIEDGVAEDIARLTERVEKVSRAKTPQEIRDEIVERAKADVRALETKRIDNVPLRNGYTATFNLCPRQDFVRFEINRDKRTVVALLLTRDGHVWARGIAKCAPGDVFNAHIGRAIALRRALGLEIPAEYLTVPNPEEPRVGDVVKPYAATAQWEATLTKRHYEEDGIYGKAWEHTHDSGWIGEDQVYIRVNNFPGDKTYKAIEL